ncbi:hypothetical protein SAMN02799631_00385 [Methylobacterium sp. 174MFSha1.1]|nr:hypothetical protein SAMN02799631_00385 [Methylobacterium sp. 174MFSha1.1]
MARGANGVLAASDGVFYGPDGRVHGFGSKILLMPECGAVMVAQGMGFLLPTLRFEIGFAAADFDRLKDILPSKFEEVIAWLRRESGVPTNGKLFLGGFSPGRARFETYAISSQPEGDTPAYTLRPMAYAEGAPWPGAELRARYGLDDPAIVSDPFEIATRFMAGARNTPCPMDQDLARSNFQVGGFVQVAMVTEDGCSTSIIHRWPDHIGEMIDPASGPNCASEVTGASSTESST